ncbi:MAG: heparin lyase I family protein [Chitinophagaceae bacterium]|nr:heparin lyase I family protein [Chitinophagaceae bacterium]
MKKIIYPLFFFTVLSAKAQIVVHAGWETGDVYQTVFSHGSICSPWGATVSDSVARRGKHSVRFELNASDTICGYSKRAELTIPTSPDRQDIVWYAWSELLPEDYAYDTHNELHFQLHHVSKYGPPLIGLWITKDRWKLVHTFDTADIKNEKHTIRQYDLGPVSKGKWVDWALYTNFKLDSTGNIRLWRNGELLLNVDGANFNREDGLPQKSPYLKFGIYKWPWKDYAGPLTPIKEWYILMK